MAKKYEVLAQSLRDKLLKDLNNARQGKDKEIKFCHSIWLPEIAEVIKYCDAVLAGNMDDARRIQENMDSGTVEVIADYLYSFVEKYFDR